jgi:hypothetical protein
MRHKFEVIGFRNLSPPYRYFPVTDEHVVASFSASYGVLNITGILLLRANRNGGYRPVFQTGRQGRIHTTAAARRELAAVAASYLRDLPPKGSAEAIRSQYPAPREGVSIEAGQAGAGD